MSDELSDLRERFSNLSNDELLKIVQVDYEDYREDALDIAKEELKKRNIKEDIINDKKEEIIKKPVELPVRWLKFYTYFRLPLVLIFTIISTGAYLQLPIDEMARVIFIAVTAIFAILIILVFIGLHKKRLWGWKLNWVFISFEIVLSAFGRAEDGVTFGIFLSIAALIWFLPNYIYFNKRRLLFS